MMLKSNKRKSSNNNNQNGKHSKKRQASILSFYELQSERIKKKKEEKVEVVVIDGSDDELVEFDKKEVEAKTDNGLFVVDSNDSDEMDGTEKTLEPAGNDHFKERPPKYEKINDGEDASEIIETRIDKGDASINLTIENLHQRKFSQTLKCSTHICSDSSEVNDDTESEYDETYFDCDDVKVQFR
ncbi:unnamed protein product [Ambrosiozyma monospora]|uniref:Unnamed protein product n=1 Tax=Ambrosiozyma monospora TaxID=43982 RepID=A0ACB5TGJ9_AMBMO|nr:unnamed protein product [Ambrosiozyma monospora]